MKSHSQPDGFLADNEVHAAELINPTGNAPIVLICEHASNFIPEALNDLGLSQQDLVSHAAWDIGAYEMACKVSELLDAPLIASRVSRLVYDCNRAPESGAGIPTQSENISVPGNKDLNQSDINDRVKSVYEPFHSLIQQTIDDPKRLAISPQHASPVIITLHSFTPIYFGEVRIVELGILHDKDDRLAKAMMSAALNLTHLKAEFNSPYAPSDNVMHTINKYALEPALLNVMIEVKNDLLSNDSEINSMATQLSEVIKEALTSLDIPSNSGDTNDDKTKAS